MSRILTQRLAILVAAAWLVLIPVRAEAQKALVYCPVGVDATVGLDVDQRACGTRTEDAVDAPAVEAEPTERRLQLGDVVATQVW